MKIELPYKLQKSQKTTDSLSDFYAVLSQVINFYQESLMMYSATRDSIIPKLIPERKGQAYGYKSYTIPSMLILERSDFHSELYPIRLFNNTIVNTASAFEIYLRDLATEIYRYNSELLKIDEKQLSSKEILEFNNLDDIKEELIERAVTNLIMNNYPELVKKFESRFHIGIHSAKSPISQYEIHHFLEVRNIIVHNEGHASKLFFTRLNKYALSSPLGIDMEFSTPNLNFEYLNEFKDKLIELAEFIDIQAKERWETTVFEHK
jgi:hypothetical protein